MRPDNTHNRPTLLLISGCFPDPDRAGEAARTWRLMCAAARTHRVFLTTMADRPVNLAQWRTVADRVHRVQIAPSGRRWFSPSPVCGEIKAWVRQHRFDTMLSMSHRVWPAGCKVQADTKICDLTHDLPGVSAKDQAKLNNPRVAEERLTDAVHTRMARVIRACDTLLVSNERQAELLRGHTTPIVRLADDDIEQIWPRMFAPVPVAGKITPNVAVLPVQPVQNMPLRKAA